MSKLVLDAKGLVVAPGELSRAPGALVQADNVNIEAPGIIRSRPGIRSNGITWGGGAFKIVSTQELAGRWLSNLGTGAGAPTTLKVGTPGTPTTLSTAFTNQVATRMQVAVSKRNHYLTSDEAVCRMESDLSFSTAGMPKGLALDLTGPAAVLSGAPGVVISDTEAVAYRVTWCKKDAQAIVMEGAPSSRTVVYNNTRTTGWVVATAKNVTCRILVPKQAMTASTALTTSYFYRLYRSRAEASGVTPSDDMNLVAEAFLSAGDITAGYVDVTDSTPEAFRTLGPALYTNPNVGGDDGVGGPGVKQSNNAPPRARDAVLFSECVFYSDLRYPAALEFTLLSTVAATGLTAGDTLTIGGIVYTCIAPGAPANNQFVVATVAAGSTASEAIERTAQNLVECINKSTTNTTTWAHYISNPEGLPGNIRIEARTITTAFTAVASAHGTAYRPSLATAVTALIDTFSNGYAFSKPAKGDAVPSVNIGFIGRDDTSLLRQVVLRDSIFQFTDAGIYRLTGRSFADFQSQEFDLSFRLLGRELVCVCDDFIYAWGFYGIARISAAGVEYVSNSIEPMLAPYSTPDPTRFTNDQIDVTSKYAWAVSYNHKVVFGLPNFFDGVGPYTNCASALVYDVRMQAWSKWIFSAGTDSTLTQGHSCAAVSQSNNLLWLGQWDPGSNSPDIGILWVMRVGRLATDYADYALTVGGTNTAVAFTKTVKWNAVTDSPEKETHWDEAHLFFDVSSVVAAWTTPTALTVKFTSDFASASAANAVAPTALSRMSKASVPREQRRSARQSVTVVHSTVSEYFGLEGMALVHLPGEGTSTVRT